MKLINKLRQKGLNGLWNAVVRRFGQPINRASFRHYAKKAIDPKLILLESEGDFCDNAYGVYDHMVTNGYLDTYRVCWLVDHPQDPRFQNIPNVRFLSKQTDRYNPKLMKALAQCRWYIYDHNCLYDYLSLPRRPEQTVAYLSHGAGFKASKGKPADFVPTFDVLFGTGKIPADILAKFWNYDPEKVVQAGYPRLDFFFRPDDPGRKKVREALKLDRYRKVLLWMPTFRQSQNKSISEDYLQNETGLPLLTTRAAMQHIDQFLTEENVLMILKVHHLQAKLPIFQETFQNILVLQDSQLTQMGVQLYQFIPETDGLITDYSSISIDYTLLDKPIIYTLDDYEAYASSRGFYPEDPKQYMTGHQVYDTQQLIQAIGDLCQGKDPYRQDRVNILPQLFRHPDGNAGKRVLDYLGIQK